MSFPRSFHARQFERIAGFEIVWTSNLADHLLVLDMDEKVKLHVFHQVRMLKHHLQANVPIIPRDLILETFDTLSLLIPRQIRDVKRWYLSKQQSSNLDPGALHCEYLNLEDRQIEHFKYWGDRLLKLKRTYDCHEPHGPIQWWRDDRKKVQWWTFWVAVLVLILTIVFGAIQSVTAIMQSMK
ncbi:hypothetical protein BDZ45DRAFT_586101 [Acephala macrosclerotiorum]|nr:hypothetical protein BDZ45DRAFT_586101 [Acephala macrosclerotiorum]